LNLGVSDAAILLVHEAPKDADPASVRNDQLSPMRLSKPGYKSRTARTIVTVYRTGIRLATHRRSVVHAEWCGAVRDRSISCRVDNTNPE
jgi:hypothetical protein